MSPADLIQLYAPLAGLVALAFWVGSLSQRVKGLEVAAADNKEMEKSMIRLVVLVEQLTRRVDELAKELSWLSNIPAQDVTPPRRPRKPQEG